MRREKQREVVKLVRFGYDIEAACAKAGVRPTAIEGASGKFKIELREAFSEATATLRAKALELALEGKDAGLLMRLLDQRDATMLSEGKRIDTITRTIIRPRCPKCGYADGPEDDIPDVEVARRIAYTLAQADPKHGHQPSGPKLVHPKPEPEARPEPAARSKPDKPEPEAPSGRRRYKRIFPDKLVPID